MSLSRRSKIRDEKKKHRTGLLKRLENTNVQNGNIRQKIRAANLFFNKSLHVGIKVPGRTAGLSYWKTSGRMPNAVTARRDWLFNSTKENQQ